MKKETVEEYIARGGVIQKIPTVKPNFSQKILVQSSSREIMGLEDGAHYFSEFKPKHKKRPKLDLSALPESIRKLANAE